MHQGQDHSLTNQAISVLLVDDEEDIIDLYENALTYSTKCTIFRATSAEDGIRVIDEHQPDIVVSDFKMPGEKSGLDILKHIVSKQLQTKFVMQTGFATIEMAIQAMKQGAYDFLVKPVSLSHFLAIIDKCIDAVKTDRENTQLKTDNLRLTELNEIKEKFITITNHELRTPLTILKGYVDLLDCFMNDDISPDLQQHIETIQTTLGDFEYIIERMHTASHLNRQVIPKAEETFDFVLLINEIIDQFALIFNDRELLLEAIFPKETVELHTDRNLIKKAIREVIQNAVKFTPNKGTIQIELSITDGFIKLQISDDGIGIDEQNQHFIFDMFYEAQDTLHHSTSSQNFMGSSLGIGLYLVKEIADVCQFKISFDSEKNRGSQFSFLFNLA